MSELESSTGLTFPGDTVLLNADDGGRHDPKISYYEWTIFSKSPINLPKTTAPGVVDYLSLPLNDSVQYVEVRTGSHKISKPFVAFGSDWENPMYTFRGTLVRAQDGDYLVVERFRK